MLKRYVNRHVRQKLYIELYEISTIIATAPFITTITTTTATKSNTATITAFIIATASTHIFWHFYHGFVTLTNLFPYTLLCKISSCFYQDTPMFGTIQTFLPGTASRQYPALLWDIQCLSCSTVSVYGSVMNAMMTNKGHYKIVCHIKKNIVLGYCAQFILKTYE